MNLRRALGLDTLAGRYAYAHDDAAGYTSARRVPDRWVPTTCGYCSVGCGMFIGVKDGRAVGVRGNPDHPVNAGVLCPKGTMEAVARALPKTLAAMAALPEVRQWQVDVLGAAFLAALTESPAEKRS